MRALGVCGGAVLAFLVCATGPGPARADFNDSKPISFSVDGGSATGYFKVVAEAVNAIIREVYPGSDASYKPGAPAGGVLNIGMGKSDIVYTGAAPEIAYALAGKPPFPQPLAGKFGWVAMLHNGNTIHSFVTKEWSDKHGVRSYAELAAKKPPFRAGVNQLATMQSYHGGALAILNAHGIAEGDIEKWGGSYFRSNTATNLEAFRDGKIDGVINGGFVPTAAIADIARSREVVWLEAEADKIHQAADAWKQDYVVVPKGAYAFLRRDEPTVTSWSAMLAGSHVADEVVYKWLKAVSANLDRFRSVHPSLQGFTLEGALRNPLNVPLHPGAARFYREKGLIK